MTNEEIADEAARKIFSLHGGAFVGYSIEIHKIVLYAIWKAADNVAAEYFKGGYKFSKMEQEAFRNS